MLSPHVIHWAPDAESLFQGVIEDIPPEATPMVRQAGAAATVYTTRGRNASEVNVNDVLAGLRLGTPDRFFSVVRDAVEARGHQF